MEKYSTARYENTFNTRNFLDQLDPLQIKAIYAETDPATLRKELDLSRRLENYRTCQAIHEWLITLQ